MTQNVVTIPKKINDNVAPASEATFNYPAVCKRCWQCQNQNLTSATKKDSTGGWTAGRGLIDPRTFVIAVYVQTRRSYSRCLRHGILTFGSFASEPSPIATRPSRSPGVHRRECEERFGENVHGLGLNSEGACPRIPFSKACLFWSDI